MPDTVRSRTELEGLLPIQTAGEVSVQDLRDVLASTVLKEDTATTPTANKIVVRDSVGGTQLTILNADTVDALTINGDVVSGDNVSATNSISINSGSASVAMTNGTYAFRVSDPDTGSNFYSVSQNGAIIGSSAIIGGTNILTAITAAGTTAASNLSAHTSATSVHGATSANTASRIVARDASGNFAASTISAANFIGEKTKTGITISAGVVLSPAVSKGSVVPYDATITQWFVSADVATTASVSLRLNSASGTILSASAPITLTSSTSNNSTTLTGWTINLNKGDVIYYDLTSNTAAKSLDIDLLLTHR